MSLNCRKKLMRLNPEKMKKNNYLKIILPSVFCCLYFFVNAQGPLPCGPYKIDTAALRKALDFEKVNRFTPATAPSIVIRVYFHIGAYDDGSNPAATADTVNNSEFSVLVSEYAPNDICFVNAGFNYINNTNLDTNFNGQTGDFSVFNPYLVPNCINIFYPKKIKGKNGACGGNCGIGGVAPTIPGTFCLISASTNISQGQTIAHEVGHCLGLYHTFETAFGDEDIDGSNSSTTGDLIADTHADPFAYNTLGCYSTSSNGCTYTGTCTDPKGQSGFVPPYTNLMSYWWAAGCYPALLITTNQYSRVDGFLFTNSPLLACESPSTEILSNVNVSSGYYMQSAISNLTTSNSVILSGTANATLGGSLITLEPGFMATPSSGGLVLVRPEACGVLPSSLVADNANNPPDQNINSLFAYPNPTSSLANLVFNLQHSEDYGLIKVYDMNMKIVKEYFLGTEAAGKHTISLNLENLSAGIYSITLQLTRTIIRTRVILTK